MFSVMFSSLDLDHVYSSCFSNHHFNLYHLATLALTAKYQYIESWLLGFIPHWVIYITRPTTKHHFQIPILPSLPNQHRPGV